MLWLSAFFELSALLLYRCSVGRLMNQGCAALFLTCLDVFSVQRLVIDFLAEKNFPCAGTMHAFMFAFAVLSRVINKPPFYLGGKDTK
ncbi:MAG TPA: hypothetical protein DDZ57_07640 [Porphyromonadaceae bacterium]|jgi:hypothetical protein|nr:hypothetical protein [Porphyromonadaceae bacterium]